MKKTLKQILTLILAVTVIVASCSLNAFAAEKATGIAINEENFPDDNFRNYLLNGSYYIWDDNGNPIEIVYDADKDGYLCESEIKNIRQLQIQQSPITDLTGIEHLTSLIEVGCQYSAVEKMDLSNNTELIYLSCHKSNLKGELDLSNNAKLQMVTCHKNPELTSVNIAGCKDLSFIDLTATDVTQLDISDNTELTGIAFDATNINHIDTSNNKKLMTLSAYNTQLSSLDLSDNPELTYLDVSNCKLSGLDLSKNDALTYLNINGNPLAWINIGKNNNLDTQIYESTISLQIGKDAFDITEVFEGIDPDRVSIVSGAEKNGNIISSYNYNTPIIYTYDCGTDINGPVTLTVTVNLTQA